MSHNDCDTLYTVVKNMRCDNVVECRNNAINDKISAAFTIILLNYNTVLVKFFNLTN